MLEKLFKFNKRKTNVKIEFIAGITTFLAVSYILFVNPQLLAETGINYQTVFLATIISASIGCFLCAFCGNLPIVIAPGMGINAFFAYTMCMGMGLSWQSALLATLISGIILIIISITKIHVMIINSIPQILKNAITIALGFFITLVGMKNAGLVISNPDTLLSLGNLQDPKVVLTIICCFIAIFFAIKQHNLGLFYTMLIGVIVSLICQYIFKIDLGLMPITSFQLPDLSTLNINIFTQIDYASVLINFNFWIVIISLVFVDFFDVTGVLLAAGNKAQLINDEGHIENEKEVMIANGVATFVGGLVGTSPTVTYMESISGIIVGGRTGFVALIGGICFLLSALLLPLINYLTPIMSIITTPALILVGIMMVDSLKNINYDNLCDIAVSFITIIITITAYSIAAGIGAGLITYVILQVMNQQKVNLLTILLAIIFIFYFIFL